MGTTAVGTLLTPDKDVRQTNVPKPLKGPREIPGELTHREHVAQHRSRASGFDSVTCSCVGDCNERVFAVADIVSVCDAKNQPCGWYVAVVNPYAPSKLSIPGDQQGYLLNLRVGKASNHWTTSIAPRRAAKSYRFKCLSKSYGLFPISTRVV